MSLAKFEKGTLNLVGMRMMGRVKAGETQSGAMAVIWVRGLGPGGSDERGRSERIFFKEEPMVFEDGSLWDAREREV